MNAPVMNQNHKSFADQMAQAQIANKGASVHSSWKVKRVELTGLDALEKYLNQWRKDQSYYAHLAVEMALFPDEFVEF